MTSKRGILKYVLNDKRVPINRLLCITGLSIRDKCPSGRLDRTLSKHSTQSHEAKTDSKQSTKSWR